jgi:hypothetical protein
VAETVGEQVEMRLVARIVHTCDHLGNPVLLARELADHEVVLVVAGEGGDDVGRPGDPRALEHVDLRGIAQQHVMLELLLEPLEAVAPLLDQRHLVALVLEQHPREVGADLPAACDEDVHQCLVQ